MDRQVKEVSVLARKRVDKNSEYVVTRIGYCVGGQVDQALTLAYRLKSLRSDIWNKYGSLQAWGVKADALYKNFQQTNPPAAVQGRF